MVDLKSERRFAYPLLDIILVYIHVRSNQKYQYSPSTNVNVEFWRPVWGIRTALIALISFLPTPGDGAISALDYTEVERVEFAKRSRDWTCVICGCRNRDVLPDESAVPVEKAVPEAGLTFSVKAEDVENSNGSSENGIVATGTSNNDAIPSVNNQCYHSTGSNHQLPPSTIESTQAQPQLMVHHQTPPPADIPPPPLQRRASIQQNATILHRKRQIDTALLFIVVMIFFLGMRRLAPYSSHYDDL